MTMSRSIRSIVQLPLASSSRAFSSTVARSIDSQVQNDSPSSSEDLQPWRNFTGPDFPTRRPLPRTHGIPVASLTLSAHHPYRLELLAEFAWQSAQSLGIPAARPAPLKKSKELVTVLKAPFVYKKTQENFERRHHHREIIAYDANKETIELWLQYVRTNSLGGVGMKATLHEWMDVGFGDKTVQGGEGTTQGRVAQEAERLLEEFREEASAPASGKTQESLAGEDSAENVRAGREPESSASSST